MSFTGRAALIGLVLLTLGGSSSVADAPLAARPRRASYDHLLLRLDRVVALGDRWKGTVAVSPGRIVIGPTVSAPKSTEIRFE